MSTNDASLSSFRLLPPLFPTDEDDAIEAAIEVFDDDEATADRDVPSASSMATSSSSHDNDAARLGAWDGTASAPLPWPSSSSSFWVSSTSSSSSLTFSA
jgi:hypothetical protein